MRIESSAQAAMEMVHSAQENVNEVVQEVAGGNIEAAADLKPAELEAAISVEVFGKVMDVHESIAMGLIDALQKIDVSI